MKKAGPAPPRSPSSSATGPDDTFGWGVVFSDETLSATSRRPIRRAIAAITRELRRAGRDIDVFVPRRARALDRPRLLRPLAQAAAADPPRALPALGVRARASRARSRPRRAATRPTSCSPPTASTAACARRYAGALPADRRLAPLQVLAGSGTDLRLEAFTFIFQESEHGLFQVHAYPFDADDLAPSSSSAARRPGGAPGSTARTRPRRVAYLERLFADDLRGPPAAHQPLDLAHVPDRPQRALAPRQRRAARRRRAHRALLDRLGHQARDGGRDRAGRGASAASTRRRARRCSRPTRRRARPRWRGCRARRRRSLEWFENSAPLLRQRPAALHLQPDDAQQAHHLRQPARGAIPRWSSAVTARFARAHPQPAVPAPPRPPCPATPAGRRAPPLFPPFRLRGLTLANRVVVSPMCQYSATTARPTTGTSCTSAAARSAAPAS